MRERILRPARLSAVVAALAVAALLAVAWAAACASFSADEPPATAPVPEGGSPDGDGGMAESGGEAATDASTVGHCGASDAQFCVDFDEGSLAAGRTGFNASDAATVELDTTFASSTPASMHMRVDPGLLPASTVCDYARAHRKLTDLPATENATFSFDVWVGSRSAASTATVSSAGVGSVVVKSCQAILVLGSTGCTLRFEETAADGGVTPTTMSDTFPVPNAPKWSHIELRTALAAAKPTMTYSVDGIVCAAPMPVPPSCAGPATFEIYPGLYCVGRGQGIVEANIDNVEFRVE